MKRIAFFIAMVITVTANIVTATAVASTANNNIDYYINDMDFALSDPDRLASYDMLSSGPGSAEALAAFTKAYPRISMLRLVRKRLVSILNAYKNSSENTNNDLTIKAMALIQKTFPEPSQGDPYPTPFTVQFYHGLNDRFQVVGVDPDRLAINTGREIIFNIDRIMKKDQWGLADSVQLWLHEILHLDTDTALDVKDKWGAQVTQFVAEHSQEFSIQDKKIYVLQFDAEASVQDKLYLQDEFIGLNERQKQLIQDVKENFLIFKQDSRRTDFWDQVYEGFKTFHNMLRLPEKTLDGMPIGAILYWPKIKVNSAKMTAPGKIQIGYTQKPIIYQKNAYSYYEPLVSQAAVEPRLYSGTYRIELDPSAGDLAIQRDYMSELPDGDFELNRVEIKSDKKYISLRLKLKDVANQIKANPTVHLIGKDLQNSQLLSLENLKYRVINADEILLHFQIPNRNIELSQIRMPYSDDDHRYFERTIRPSQPVTLPGAVAVSANQFKVNSLRIEEKKMKTDKVLATLNISSNKKVIGITLDLQHELSAYSVKLVNFNQNRTDNMSYLGEGRKYFISSKNLKWSGQTVQFAIPEVLITQVQDGPVMKQQISSFYTDVYQNQYQTIHDTRHRSIMGLWLHFADGSIEKSSDPALIKNFTLESKEEKKKDEENIAAYCNMLFD
jgi:hypothetical protein